MSDSLTEATLKKKRNHSRFGCWLTTTLPVFLLRGSPAATPQEGHSCWSTLTSVTGLPCSSSPPPFHQSDSVGTHAAPSSQLHVKVQVRHGSCHHPRTIPPDVCHERPHILHDHDQALFPIFLFSPHLEKKQDFLKLQDKFPSLLVYYMH